MKRFREDIELEVSVKTDEPDQLAEYTKMVLGDNAEFFDCDFDDCKPCKDVDEFEDKSTEVFDDEDDDDMTDDEFIEAFGKAMKEKHDEVLTEGEFTDKVKGFVKNKVTDPLKKKAGFDVKSGAAQYAVREFKLTKEKEKDQDGKETGKDIVKRTIVGTAQITPDYKAAVEKAKRLSKEDGGSNAGIRASIAVIELKDVFKDVCDKYDLKISKNTPASWIEVAIFKDGDVDPKYPDKHTPLESKVNSLIKKEKEDKKFNKKYGNSFQEVDPETGEAINQEQEAPADEEPDVTEIPIEHASTSAEPTMADIEKEASALGISGDTNTSAPKEEATPAREEENKEEPTPAEGATEAKPEESKPEAEESKPEESTSETPTEQTKKKGAPAAATAAKVAYNKAYKAMKDAGIDVSGFTYKDTTNGVNKFTQEFKDLVKAINTQTK